MSKIKNRYWVGLIFIAIFASAMLISCGGGGGGGGGGTSGGSSTPPANTPSMAVHFGGGTASSAGFRTDGFISPAVGIVSSANYKNEIR